MIKKDSRREPWADFELKIQAKKWTLLEGILHQKMNAPTKSFQLDKLTSVPELEYVQKNIATQNHEKLLPFSMRQISAHFYEQYFQSLIFPEILNKQTK